MKIHPVVWWTGWITLTILAFFAAFFFWTPIIAKNVGGMNQAGAPILWVTAVFGTWMVFLVPLIVVMYGKVDKAYEDARLRREGRSQQLRAAAWKVPAVDIPEQKRRLPKAIVQKLKREPWTIRRGHLVSIRMKDGHVFKNAFILDRTTLLGIYDEASFPYSASDVEELTPVAYDKIPQFDHAKWLRLDGAGSG